MVVSYEDDPTQMGHENSTAMNKNNTLIND